ncbi:hypothetical protein M011DRAFT_202281 [Sporormia fimetaria CBS 119925]|uniref:Uncharacterized protein n=1 Tax=Sporormia fimetaria CBS 119925 TaxID=1340428 RepID=A0A6A6V0Q4_9PLEO|nr:hypothetical protein M011DRAFT_202281 [Sporormia fimetaria CBS 119925]
MSQYQQQPNAPPPPQVRGMGDPLAPRDTHVQQVRQPMSYAPQYAPQQHQQSQAGQQQHVLLGYVNSNEGNLSRAVYGPPGAQFDTLGNVYFQRDQYTKEYVGPYKDYKGRITQPPKQRRPLIGSCWGPTWLDWCLGR